ncbi:hypothetical protein CMI42_00655 [Candidatus Pacearchaeota archaeon]|nr:hypothetical protein [Candidatus Pacearchaeota archaeon]|tara:strand:- start:1321 stop:1689 length:369 start_codon:yes stop_codon:yes gene_type:complete
MKGGKKEMKKVMIVMLIIMLVSLFFLVQGVNMHMNVSKEESKFHSLQDSYFSKEKSIRDGAETNSDLNSQLVEIKNYPSELLRLKLVGVGKILTGIYVLLFGILMALIMMPSRLGRIIKGKK